MFQNNRIRSLVAISALTGATVLGGAGLAGATGGSDTDTDPVEETSVVEAGSTSSDDMSTGEADGQADSAEREAYLVELETWTDCVAEEAAAHGDAQSDESTRVEDAEFDATAACGEKPEPTWSDAEAEEQDDADTDADADEASTGGDSTDVEGEGPPADSHGARVSAVATSGSGEGHGEDVSEVARQQGEERHQAAQENRAERGSDQGETVEDDDLDDGAEDEGTEDEGTEDEGTDEDGAEAEGTGAENKGGPDER